MNQEIRNRLRNVVTKCRTLLEKSLAEDLEGRFRIYARNGIVTADPNAPTTHLTTDEEKAARKDILDHFEHIKARGFKSQDALDQLIREIAFTHLNRFCAYKMMEAREVYVGGQKFREAVSRGFNSNGVKFYLADHPDDERLFNTGQQDIAYRHFLDWLGGQLSEEIGVLFNPNDPANRLYPRQSTLDEVLDLLNTGGIKPDETELRDAWPSIWSSDETIGWVYQYFTPKELRDQARKESAAPRNSYELAFRNQFFTPRYVVEFLTDNTLGRIWYEMRKGDTKLKDQCSYMVRRPNESFLRDGEEAPVDSSSGVDDLSQDELLNRPACIPHRPKKDPRDIKILDPASGSGHFLLYCFDLLQTIYDEAYCDPELGAVLKHDYETVELLRRDVPRLILAHNLHGVDIDLRASQIAALALWLRCQKAFQEAGLKKDRPKINRSNFVCAEPMPGEGQILKEFVSQLEPTLLGQLVEVVFEKMKLAGEAGSLLKIDEEIRGVVAAAKKQWLRESAQAIDRKGHPLLFTQSVMDRLSGKPEQAALFDLSGISDAQFFEEAEAKVINALNEYAAKAQGRQRFVKTLFANDAVRGFAFVDLCNKRYDVVLMNPPFGSPSLIAEDYLQKAYPAARYESYGQFLIRAREWTDGYVGALTSRGFLFLANYQSIREAVLPYLSVFLDLGAGVLDDAFVEVCASVVGSGRRDDVLCIDDRSGSLRTSHDAAAFLPALRLFPKRYIEYLEQSPFCYDTDPHILALFRSKYTLEKGLGGLARVGLATGDNERFIRCHWEVPVSHINGRWKWHAKGGEYLPFKPDVHLVVDWLDNGKPIEDAFEGARIHKDDVYFRPAVTYSRRSLKGLSFRALPKGCICSEKGPVMISPGNEHSLLALANSSLFKYMVAIQSAASAFEIGAIQRVPLPQPYETVRPRLEKLGRKISGIYAKTACLDETDIGFVWPSFWSKARSISEAATILVGWLNEARQQTCCLIKELDQVVCEAYQVNASAFPENDYTTMTEAFAVGDEQATIARLLVSFALGSAFGRWDVRVASGKREVEPLLDVFNTLPCSSPVSLVGEEATSSTYPIHFNADGILPEDPDHVDDIVKRVREVFDLIFNSRADSIEAEACAMLGVKNLRDYFRKPSKGGFWDDHVGVYSKSRRTAPIYLLLQSSKKNYSLWIYYHRLDKDVLFKAIVNYVEPRIRLQKSHLEGLQAQGRTSTENINNVRKRLAKEVEREEDFLSELLDFEAKLHKVANLHLVPDLNDGVILNAAALHELMPWKAAKSYWEELLEGKYEWSSIGKQLRQKGLVR